MSALFTTSSKLSLVKTRVASGGGFQSGWATSLTRSTMAEKMKVKTILDQQRTQKETDEHLFQIHSNRFKVLKKYII